MRKNCTQMVTGILGLICFIAAQLSAQQLATLNVTVTDPSGSLVSHARVTLRNMETDANRPALTGAGIAVIPGLPAGKYQLRVDSNEFSSYQATLLLTVGQNASVAVGLAIKAVEENVEVHETVQGVDSQKSEVSQVIDARKIYDLPISGRDFIDFALLTPNVNVGRSTSVGAQSPFQETVLQLSFSGLRETHSAFFGLDGTDYTTSISGVQPLTVISSAAENIAHGVVDSQQQLAQYGSVIRSQAQQLSGLVEQVLSFAAPREGRQSYNSQILGVSEIIEVALANTSSLSCTAQFTVEQHIAPDLPPVRGDLLALAQCLQNLITNAVKYGMAGRWIGLCASLEERGVQEKQIRIGVSDRGIGISPSDLPHIFEPFYRSPTVSAAQIHGTGLGLPLAKSIAEAMNGDLTASSELGRGSTFTLHLPICESSKVNET